MKHRNLLEMIRALLFQSHLPSHLWGECLLTSTYIIDRIHTSVLGYDLMRNYMVRLLVMIQSKCLVI